MYSGFKVETHDVLPRADEEMPGVGMEVKQEHQQLRILANSQPDDACASSTHPTTQLKSPKHSTMILPQVHLRKPCYDFFFL